MKKSESGKIMSLRFNKTELEVINKKIPDGIKLSEFCKQIILNSNVTVKKVKRIDPKLLLELNRIGNNINQICRLAHIEGCEEILNDTKDIKNFMESLLKKYVNN